MMIDSDKLEEQIMNLKLKQSAVIGDLQEHNNGFNIYLVEYFKGYICALCVVEGMIAELRGDTDGSNN